MARQIIDRREPLPAPGHFRSGVARRRWDRCSVCGAPITIFGEDRPRVLCTECEQDEALIDDDEIPF